MEDGGMGNGQRLKRDVIVVMGQQTGSEGMYETQSEERLPYRMRATRREVGHPLPISSFPELGGRLRGV